ncbi:MAG: NADH-quinone oxidoreductase subunit J [Gammaproteobacteria bacterium]|nr:NADH-quinone oxidoreductase subunit J [Gammaproteobacteria bacterium]
MLFPIHQVIFYVFTVLLIASATMVITAKNPVKAVLFLVVAFFASAVLWMSMQAEFLSLLLIFVYVGAVMTLFLFVVMMLKTENTSSSLSPSLLLLGFLCLVILVGTALYVFSANHWSGANTLPTHYDANYNNVVAVGTLLFTDYLFPFEICAVLLLVGMISAIALAFHGRKPGTKSQSISKQISATKKDRLRVVDLRDKRP